MPGIMKKNAFTAKGQLSISEPLSGLGFAIMKFGCHIFRNPHYSGDPFVIHEQHLKMPSLSRVYRCCLDRYGCLHYSSNFDRICGPSDRSTTWVCWTDGSYEDEADNDGFVGWGIRIKRSDSADYAEAYGGCGTTVTYENDRNYLGEALGIVCALTAVSDVPRSEVTIWTDCDSLRTSAKRYPIQTQRLRIRISQRPLLRAIESLSSLHDTVLIRHVYSHTNLNFGPYLQNKEADRLANEGRIAARAHRPRCDFIRCWETPHGYSIDNKYVSGDPRKSTRTHMRSIQLEMWTKSDVSKTFNLARKYPDRINSIIHAKDSKKYRYQRWFVDSFLYNVPNQRVIDIGEIGDRECALCFSGCHDDANHYGTCIFVDPSLTRVTHQISRLGIFRDHFSYIASQLYGLLLGTVSSATHIFKTRRPDLTGTTCCLPI